MKAFSLVELSIVLVVLGLLTGGILAGQSLIRGAEMRAVTDELSRYASAVETFHERYSVMPGDMPNATDFWGVLAGDGTNATCQATSATGLPTCNGNGDGWVAHGSVPFCERFRSWQHLANAGLIEGKYTGAKSGTDDTSWTAGVNVPAGHIAHTAFQLEAVNWTVQPNHLVFVGTQWGHYLNLINTSYLNSVGFLLPEEIWKIDEKLDDGFPGTGALITYDSSGHTGCVTSDDPVTARYDLSQRQKTCLAMLYRVN